MPPLHQQVNLFCRQSRSRASANGGSRGFERTRGRGGQRLQGRAGPEGQQVGTELCDLRLPWRAGEAEGRVMHHGECHVAPQKSRCPLRMWDVRGAGLLRGCCARAASVTWEHEHATPCTGSGRDTGEQHTPWGFCVVLAVA